ncbi:hypothetical protein BC835DRAFT_1415252 [Cytidiella melzeri]|nr:hypothetical protein BC835DRAFT_1415252 [Cytidiella melzeri]
MPDGTERTHELTAGISASDYAARTRRLIRLIKDLRALGGESELNLPRIAVIGAFMGLLHVLRATLSDTLQGNQSAGKSSLVEAISGITVPRASGTYARWSVV